jgi:hypothetical protein
VFPMTVRRRFSLIHGCLVGFHARPGQAAGVRRDNGDRAEDEALSKPSMMLTLFSMSAYQTHPLDRVGGLPEAT